MQNDEMFLEQTIRLSDDMVETEELQLYSEINKT